MHEPTHTEGARIGRYRVVELLGRGGMGEVYRVQDSRDGTTLALKCLVVPPGPTRDRAQTLFASEYQVLSEIDHPRVVSVRDYGVAPQGPYYVMALVEGEDLRQRAPMPWRQACAVLHDVCTALSLLHARRLVHRDVSPRNVRLDDAGRAVLIDFGAMAPFGPSEHTVGTPPFAAPEVVHGQRLDARADLYGLGALGYFLLAGRNAYPAQDWRQLRDQWRTRPLPLSSICDELPPALEQLITKLMSLDSAARPDSVAEVLDRLKAVAGLPPGDIDYAQSFLASPSLVGRDDMRLSFRKRMVRAMRGLGSCLLVQGETGSGRSRMLENHALEGKLVGALVMHARAKSCGDATYATVLALLRQFRDVAPDFFEDSILPHLSVLGHISPELQPHDEDPYQLVEYPDEAAQRAAVRHELVHFIQELRQHLCVLVIVDDLELCDAESAAILVELAGSVGVGRLVVVAGADRAAAEREGSAAYQLGALGGRCVLRNLTRPQTGVLLETIFGNEPHLEQLADWVFTVSRGNPGMAMRLAQHLVDSGLARLQEGHWLLPPEPVQTALPQSMDGALELQLRSLGEQARTVAQLIALTTPEFPLELRHYRALSTDPDGEGVEMLSALEELRRAGIVVTSAGHWEFENTLLRKTAAELSSTAARQALHFRLADAYEQHDAPSVVIAHHLLQAGEPGAAYERLGLAAVDTSGDHLNTPTTRFYLSAAGIELVTFGLAHAERTGGSRQVRYRFQRVLLSLAFADPSLACHAPAVLEALRHDTGLCYLPDIDAQLPVAKRIEEAMRRATQAHDAADPADRGLSPIPALFDLGAVILLLCAIYTRTYDAGRFAGLVALAAPTRNLSPASMLVHDTALMCHRSITRGEQSQALRRQLFDLTEQPVPGMDERTRYAAHLNFAFFRGIDDASAGDPQALAMAELLEHNPTHRSLGHQIRFVHHLTQGDRREARRAEARRDLFALSEVPGSHGALGPLWAAHLHYAVGDLIALRGLRPHFEQQAALYPGWKPWQLLVGGMYQILHDDHAQADALLGEGLSLAPPLEHAAWQYLRVFRIETALGMGDYALAAQRTREIDALVEREQVELLSPSTLCALGAVAIARVGGHDEALQRVDAGLSLVRERRLTGIQASRLYEARARVSLLMGDKQGFDMAARRVAAQYRPGQHPGLLARYERLMNDALAAKHEVSPELARAARDDDDDDVVTDPTFVTAVQTLLGGCHGPDERAQTALALLVERTGADAGYLYGCRPNAEIELLAQLGARPPSAAVRRRTREFFEDAIDGGATVRPSLPPPPGEEPALTDAKADFEPHLLWKRRDGEVLIAGVAVLRIENRDTRIPFELLSALSDALLDAGDVQPAQLP